MATNTQTITVSVITLPNSTVLVQDTVSGQGMIFPAAQDAINFFTVPGNSDKSRILLLQLLVAQNTIDGNAPAAINGKSISLAFTTGQNPTFTITPTP